MIEQEVLNEKIIEIFKKHHIVAYELYKEYLNDNKIDFKTEKKIKKVSLNMYLNSLEQDEKLAVKAINKAINATKKDIQFNLLATFYETYAIDIVQTYYNELLMKQANIVSFRDNQGFYGINETIQTGLDSCSLELNVLNNQIHNKEELMNGKRTIKKNTLCRKEVLILSYFLGYGDARDEILNNQDRNKVLTKNKGIK